MSAILQNISVKTKLYAGFGIVCAAIVIQGIFIIYFNKLTIREISATQTEILPHALNYIELRRDIELIQGWLTDISATRGAKGYDDGFAEAKKYFEDAESRIDFAINDHQKFGEQDTVNHLETLRKSLHDFYDMGIRMAKAYITDGPASGNPMMEKFDPYSVQLSKMVGSLSSEHVTELHESFQSMQTHAGFQSKTVLFMTIIIIILSILISLLVAAPISSALKNLVVRLKDIAEDDADLTERLQGHGNDELGAVAKWFNLFIKRIHDIVVKMGENAQTVTAASGEMLTTSEQVADGAEELFGKANTVSVAAEEMSANMNSVAAASEEASTNIRMVADSASQMQATLGEVAANCEKAREISKDASTRVNEASQRVNFLGASAREISKVTDVITEIAGQTNLLALNATIEAARAGEAGKGFAVVADEIKHLAGQTAEATEDIKKKISGIQNSTDDTIRDVTQIADVITDVSDIVNTIAAAVEEQSASATEIAQNIDQASAGIAEVNENVAQSSQVASEIAKDIVSVNEVAKTMTDRGTQMNKNARTLSQLSEESSEMIRLFKVSENRNHSDAASNLSENEVPDLMSWGPKLTLGINTIDEQHKELVNLINQLHKSMKLKRGNLAAAKILQRLTDYTVFHFNNEKALFEKHGYPDTAAHLKLHDALVEKVMEFKNSFDNGSASLSMDLMRFLTDWLNTHILKSDMKYVPFLKERMEQE